MQAYLMFLELNAHRIPYTLYLTVAENNCPDTSIFVHHICMLHLKREEKMKGSYKITLQLVG